MYKPRQLVPFGGQYRFFDAQGNQVRDIYLEAGDMFPEAPDGRYELVRVIKPKYTDVRSAGIIQETSATFRTVIDNLAKK